MVGNHHDKTNHQTNEIWGKNEELVNIIKYLRNMETKTASTWTTKKARYLYGRELGHS